MITYPEAVHFLENYCILSKDPFRGPMKLMPWQHSFLKSLYSADKDERIYKKAQLWIPKKNGKSSLISGLGLIHLLEYGGSEVYIVASTIKQASIIFNETANFVLANPALKARLQVFKHIKTIEDKRGKSKLQILVLNPTQLSGYNANLLIFEELAEWTSAIAKDAWDKTQNATAARRNGLKLVLSTAQFDLTHIGKEQFDLAQRIQADPSIDPQTLAVVYAGNEEKWQDPEEWKRVNPGWGYVLQPKEMMDDYKQVLLSPREENRFKTLRMNIWSGVAECFIPAITWQQNRQPFDEKEFHKTRVQSGVDASRKYDMTAYCLVAERAGLTYLMPRFFLPEDGIEKKEREDGQPYRQWAANPSLNFYLTPGNVVDFEFVYSILEKDKANFRIDSVGYDPNYMESTRQVWESRGLDMVAVPQTSGIMTKVVLEFEKLALAGKLRCNNAVFDYCLQNCCIREQPNGGIMLDKRKSRKRIDGVSAALVGLNRLMDQENSFAAPFISW